MSSKIKAILLDSGRVLNGPASGHWFITSNFFSYVDKKLFNSIPIRRLEHAFSMAAEYIKKQNLIITEDEEYTHFVEYYKAFFSYLPELKMTEHQIGDIAKDYVYNYEKYAFFKDVQENIQLLNDKYKLAVVSDAWPSLENVFVKAGLRHYFASFIISSKLGITKPDCRMYQTALDELNISPEEAIFVDDSIKNCDGARKLGIKTFLICRDIKLYVRNRFSCKDHIVIRGLKEIHKFID